VNANVVYSQYSPFYSIIFSCHIYTVVNPQCFTDKRWSMFLNLQIHW